ncbi:MAG: site-specific integrase, partial [Chloroflexota bacterium]
MLQQNTIKDAIKEYLTAYKQAGYSNHTVEKYGVHLENLAIWLAERDITQLEQLNKAILREWGASLHDIESPRTKKGWAPATIKQAVCSVRSFLTWCLEDDLIDYALANALKIPKVEETMQRTLDIKEAQQIINSYDDGTVMGIRNCALFSLMIDSGLRSAEVCRVQVADLQFG